MHSDPIFETALLGATQSSSSSLSRVNTSTFDASHLREFSATLSHTVGNKPSSCEFILGVSSHVNGVRCLHYVAKSYVDFRALRRRIMLLLNPHPMSGSRGCLCRGSSCVFIDIGKNHLQPHQLPSRDYLGFIHLGTYSHRVAEVTAFLDALIMGLHTHSDVTWPNECQFLHTLSLFFQTQARFKTTMKFSQHHNMNLNLKGWHQDRTLHYGVGITYE
jgi:hypothetical protein